MVLWGYPPLIYSQTGNQKSNSEISWLEFFKQVVWRWFKQWKNQFVGFVSSHKRAHCWHPSIFTALLFFMLICRRTQLWHASLHHGITLCQICRIDYFSLCNWYNIVMCHCFPPSSPITVLENSFCLGQTSTDGYKAMGFDVT